MSHATSSNYKVPDFIGTDYDFGNVDLLVTNSQLPEIPPGRPPQMATAITQAQEAIRNFDQLRIRSAGYIATKNASLEQNVGRPQGLDGGGDREGPHVDEPNYAFKYGGGLYEAEPANNGSDQGEKQPYFLVPASQFH
jgi:hypothetical protein